MLARLAHESPLFQYTVRYFDEHVPSGLGREQWRDRGLVRDAHAYPHPEQLIHMESAWIRKDHIQHRAKVKPPMQPKVRKGSICFRDLRLWHAGMPNKSDKHRITLAIDYFAQWFGCPMKLQLPQSARELMEKEWDINTAEIEWMHGEVNSLDVPFCLNMTQDPEMYLVQTEKGFEDWRARKTGKYDFDRGMVTEDCYWTPE